MDCYYYYYYRLRWDQSVWGCLLIVSGDVITTQTNYEYILYYLMDGNQQMRTHIQQPTKNSGDNKGQNSDTNQGWFRGGGLGAMEKIFITNTHIIMILFYFLIIYLFRLYLNLPDGHTTSPFYPPLSSSVPGWLLCVSSLCVSSLIGGLLFQRYCLTSNGRTTSLFQ